MHGEDFLLFLICQIFVGYSAKETSELLQCVRGYLWWEGGEGGVAKAFSRILFTGGAVFGFWRGSALSTKTGQSRDFDSTRGYPGEDIE